MFLGSPGNSWGGPAGWGLSCVAWIQGWIFLKAHNQSPVLSSWPTPASPCSTQYQPRTVRPRQTEEDGEDGGQPACHPGVSPLGSTLRGQGLMTAQPGPGHVGHRPIYIATGFCPQNDNDGAQETEIREMGWFLARRSKSKDRGRGRSAELQRLRGRVRGGEPRPRTGASSSPAWKAPPQLR